MSFDFKKFLPHLYVILALVAAALLYNSPVLIGKGLKMEDMTQVAGMSKELNDFKEKDGVYPLWTNALFGGMPAYQIAIDVPNMWVAKLGGVVYKWLPNPANLMLLYFLGFYVLMVILKFNIWQALFGALAFGLSSYNLIIIDAGHITKAIAIGFMPTVIGGLILLFRGKWLPGFALLSLMLALQLYAYHYQITYYLGLLIGIYVLVKGIEAVQKKEYLPFLKASGLAILALLIAIGANYTSFSITREYTKETMRGGSELRQLEDPNASTGLDKEYALKWSNGIAETFTLLIPNFYGGASVSDIGTSSKTFEVLTQGGVARNQATAFVKQAPTYFGDQPGTAGPTYFGALICFLFVLALFVVKGPAKWWLASAALLSIVLSWGRNFELVTDIFFNYVPFYNNFRAVAMSLVIASLAFPLLAVILLRRLEENQIDKITLKKGLIYATGIVGGFCLLFVAAPGAFFDFNSPSDANFGNFPGLVDALIEDRANMLRKDAFKSLLLVLIGAGAIWYFLQNKLSLKSMVILFLVANTIDLWITDKRYLNEEDFVNQRQIDQPFEATAADLRILQDTTLHYRVFDLGNRNPFNENRAGYFHKSVGGYHAAKLGRYEDVKVRWLEGQINMNVLNAFNTRWFIVNQEGQGLLPQLNTEAYGNAWLVNQVLIVPDAKAEIDTLGGTNLRQTAIVDARFSDFVAGKTFNYDSSASIRLDSYHPDLMTYSFAAATEQLAVFSEVYYEKGWNAYLNGEKVPHFRVNYLFRGLVVPAGSHTIEFKFEPATYYTGEKISLAASIILLLVSIGALAMNFKKPKTEA
ncbi:MAG: YfhO family protein [Sphingobacteriaceae bacterium]|nr:YfhO family protein [Sphingobacteriaceae bacterium]